MISGSSAFSKSSLNTWMFMVHILLKPGLENPMDGGAWWAAVHGGFPQFGVIRIVKCFSMVSEADVFLEFSCFFYDSTDVGNLISGSSVFSKSILNIWKFLVHVLLKPILENFEPYLASM